MRSRGSPSRIEGAEGLGLVGVVERDDEAARRRQRETTSWSSRSRRDGDERVADLVASRGVVRSSRGPMASLEAHDDLHLRALRRRRTTSAPAATRSPSPTLADIRDGDARPRGRRRPPRAAARTVEPASLGRAGASRRRRATAVEPASTSARSRPTSEAGQRRRPTRSGAARCGWRRAPRPTSTRVDEHAADADEQAVGQPRCAQRDESLDGQRRGRAGPSTPDRSRGCAREGGHEAGDGEHHGRGDGRPDATTGAGRSARPGWRSPRCAG